MTFIRLGGMAGLLAAVLAILINFILISPPPPYNSSLQVITNYLQQESEMIVLGTGLRYLVWPLGLIFAVGLYQFVRGVEDGNHRLWAKVRRDGKRDYLLHLPRLWRLVVGHLARPECAGLRAWFAAYSPI